MLAHISTVHPRSDTRIRIKEVASLAEGVGEPVALFVQDGKGRETDASDSIQIIDTGAPFKGRLARMTLGAWRMWRAVKAARPKVAHFHDPELIPVGLALKIAGIKVIYDVHEDVPRQILGKHWIPGWARRPVAGMASAAEWVAAAAFDGIVAATPTIAARFPKAKTVTVQNFPLLDELQTPDAKPFAERPVRAVYVGGISEIRGAREMMEAISLVPERYGLRLALGGSFSPISLRGELEALPGWAYVDALGWLQRSDVASLLSEARMGLVLFHPAPNHVDAQPNKLFEYMSAGIPVIASDFPLWRKIVDGAGCGLLVDPLDAAAIAGAMTWFLDHSKEAETMGRQGREAVESHYNWAPEAEKLLALYGRLLPQNKGLQTEQ